MKLVKIEKKHIDDACGGHFNEKVNICYLNTLLKCSALLEKKQINAKDGVMASDKACHRMHHEERERERSVVNEGDTLG